MIRLDNIRIAENDYKASLLEKLSRKSCKV